MKKRKEEKEATEYLPRSECNWRVIEPEVCSLGTHLYVDTMISSQYAKVFRVDGVLRFMSRSRRRAREIPNDDGCWDLNEFNAFYIKTFKLFNSCRNIYPRRLFCCSHPVVRCWLTVVLWVKLHSLVHSTIFIRSSSTCVSRAFPKNLNTCSAQHQAFIRPRTCDTNVVIMKK